MKGRYANGMAACAAALAAAAVLIPSRSTAVELYLERRMTVASKEITAAAFDRGSAMVACGTENGNLFIFDPATGALNEDGPPFDSGGKKITAVAFSPDGNYLAVAVEKKSVWLAGLGGRDLPVELKRAAGGIDALAFSDDGRYLAAGGDKKVIFVWEVPSGNLRSILKGHRDDVLAVSFEKDGRSIVSAGRGGMMIVWDASSMRPLRQYELEARTMEGSGIDVTAARVSADGLFLAAAIEEHMLKKGGRGMVFKYHLAFFDISKGVLLKVLEDNERKIEWFALYPGNCFAAFDNSTLQARSLALRNIESGNMDLSYPLDSPCTLLEFSPDGRWLAAAAGPAEGEKDAALLLWSVDYEMPASGCFSGRIRLTSDSAPLLKGGAARIAAVVPFSVSGTDEELGRAAANFLESALAGSPGLTLVERSRVDEILKELKLQESGFVDRSSAVEAGRLLGAAIIFTGNIDRVGADLVVSTRAIDVTTGEIIGTRQVHCAQCGADDIFDAVDALAGALVGP